MRHLDYYFLFIVICGYLFSVQRLDFFVYCNFVSRLPIMTATDAHVLSTHKKRRGVVRASLTRLNTKLSELESSLGGPDNLDIIKRLTARLDALDTDFKVHHLAIVDLINGEEALQAE